MTYRYKLKQAAGVLLISAMVFGQQMAQKATELQVNDKNQIKHVRFKKDARISQANFFDTYKKSFGLTASDEMVSSKVMRDASSDHTR